MRTLKPCDFKESTKTLQRPDTMSEKQCGSLPIWSDGTSCVSCWRPKLKDRFNILFGGKIWLGIRSGSTQPPVYVSTEKPFPNPPFAFCIQAYFRNKLENLKAWFWHEDGRGVIFAVLAFSIILALILAGVIVALFIKYRGW